MYTMRNKEIDMNMTKKEFMNTLFDAEGELMVMPCKSVGKIESVRTKLGTDLEVMVKISGLDGFSLFSAEKLFDDLNGDLVLAE